MGVMGNNTEEERENKTRQHTKIGERFALFYTWRNENEGSVWVVLGRRRT